MLPPLPLLSLDPSSTKIGWAMLDTGPAANFVLPRWINSGVALIPPVRQEERIPYVGSYTAGLIQNCRPASVLIEIPDFRADWARGHIVWYFRAVGVVEYVAFQHNLPIYSVPASADRRRERKREAIDFFHRTIGRPPVTDDESDAFWNGWLFLDRCIADGNSAMTDDDDCDGYPSP